MQASANAIANGQRADKNGTGDRDTEEGAEMAACVEAQVGLNKI